MAYSLDGSAELLGETLAHLKRYQLCFWIGGDDRKRRGDGPSLTVLWIGLVWRSPEGIGNPVNGKGTSCEVSTESRTTKEPFAGDRRKMPHAVNFLKPLSRLGMVEKVIKGANPHKKSKEVQETS